MSCSTCACVGKADKHGTSQEIPLADKMLGSLSVSFLHHQAYEDHPSAEGTLGHYVTIIRKVKHSSGSVCFLFTTWIWNFYFSLSSFEESGPPESQSDLSSSYALHP